MNVVYMFSPRKIIINVYTEIFATFNFLYVVYRTELQMEAMVPVSCVTLDAKQPGALLICNYYTLSARRYRKESSRWTARSRVQLDSALVKGGGVVGGRAPVYVLLARQASTERSAHLCVLAAWILRFNSTGLRLDGTARR